VEPPGAVGVPIVPVPMIDIDWPMGGMIGMPIVGVVGVPMVGNVGVPIVGASVVSIVGLPRLGVPIVGVVGVPIVGVVDVPILGTAGVPIVGEGGVPIVGMVGVPIVGNVEAPFPKVDDRLPMPGVIPVCDGGSADCASTRHGDAASVADTIHFMTLFMPPPCLLPRDFRHLYMDRPGGGFSVPPDI
jgi:hypothetical protein